ncbi:SapC family protein [Zhongshania marina]|uniref:SapC family protein n=1 Tax=Zhongshania marina TaxID=2304603 RepID=UPI0013047D07|nr:SapC family protein [Marortus luteolus]
MTSIVPVTKDRHTNLRWIPIHDFRPLINSGFVTLLNSELAQVARHYTFGFCRRNDDFIATCILGVGDKPHLFLNEDGSWLENHYIPAKLRVLPFHLEPGAENGKSTLCIDEKLGLSSHSSEGNHFFTEGKPSPALREIMNLIQHIQLDQKASDKAFRALASAGLLMPWGVDLNLGKFNATLNGFYQVNTELLASLPGKDLEELNQLGALNAAFLQIFSMQHIDTLQSKFTQTESDEPNSSPFSSGESDKIPV